MLKVEMQEVNQNNQQTTRNCQYKHFEKCFIAETLPNLNI
jgi:hypothetical protein